MVRRIIYVTFFLSAIYFMAGCKSTTQENDSSNKNPVDSAISEEVLDMKQKVEQYIPVKLTTDLSVLTKNEKEMLPILFEVAKIMDELFWMETFGGDKKEFLSSITDPDTLKFAEINYGPWDRLGGLKPFIAKYGKKPLGSNFYPPDIKYLEYVDMKYEDKYSMFTVIRRNEDKSLYTLPYHVAFKEKVEKAAELLTKASKLADDAGLKKYLELRAQAFLTDDYLASDMAWMDMKNNTIDLIVGPIEDEEDRFLNTKAAHLAYLLIKDKDWSEKSKKISALVPELQKSLPVDEKYKKESVGNSSDIGVYDAIYCSGFCNTGGKSISINMPKDGRVIDAKGTRKLQFKNVLKAKFEQIQLPISNILISENQRSNVNFDAFVKNSLFYEIAEGMGMKNTVNGKGSVKEALKEDYGTIKAVNAYAHRLYYIAQLQERGEYTEKELLDCYVTALANVFRSVRFGASNNYGIGNMIFFYFLEGKSAFTRDNATGTYSIDLEKTKEGVKLLCEKLLKIQGDGDYNAAKELIDEMGAIKSTLQNDLNKISKAGIPKDIMFEQGPEVIGL